jgi:Osmosensitive K+ channel histidine kinase
MKIYKIFLTILLVCTTCIQAGAKGWYFQTINPPEALSGEITSIYIQPRGYIWAGTTHGVFRFGYGDEFKWYKEEEEEEESQIPGNQIFNILPGVKGDVIIFTDKGIARYDEVNDKFRLLLENDDNKAYCTFAASNGNIYLGGDDTLFQYDLATHQISRAIPLNIGRSFRVEKIFEAQPGETLILYNKDQGYCRFQMDGDKVEIPETQLTGNTAFLVDENGRIWRSKYNRGIECYDSYGNLTASYTTSNSGLTSNIATCFLENSGNIWIGTDGGGIVILNPETGEMQSIDRNDSIYNSFPSASITHLGTDAAGSIWAISSDGRAIIARETYLHPFAVAPVFDVAGQSSDNVMSFAETAGKIWIGTASSGLYMVDKADSYSTVNVSKVEIGTHRIESMLTLSDGNILMFFDSEGLFLFNPATRQIKPFTAIDDKDFIERIQYSGIRVTLGMDNLGHVMVLSDEVHVWDPATGKVIQHPIPYHENHIAICPISHGKGMYYYCERFIYRWNADTYNHEIIFDIGNGITINSVTMDEFEGFWLATNMGVFYLEKGTDTLKKVEGEMIPNAEIVLLDSSSRLWIATSSALYAYLPQISNLMRFSNNDGAVWNRYNGTAWLYSDELLLLGGSNGVMMIDPSISFQLTDKPELVLSDVIINGERLAEYPHTLKIRSNCKTIQLNFFVKENNILRSKLFRYYFKSENNERTIQKEESYLQLSNLASGNHSVSVSYSLQNGEWTEPEEMIVLKVMPIWYRSGWFWAALLALIGIFSFILLRSLKKDNEYKLALAESEAQSNADQESVKFLLNVSHELKTPLTLIISPLSRILRNKDKNDPEYQTLTNIYRQANRMSSLILTVLDSHKIKEGTASFNAESKPLNEWVESHAKDFEEEAESRGIKLSRSFDPAIGNINMDAPKLENVITNMMINALKHSPEGTTITVGTEHKPQSGMVRVFVSDQGEGLGGVDMTKLFSRFYQGYAQKSGSGLGLAYANSIVEMHKGTMGAFENKGGGATFYFDLPGGEDINDAIPAPNIEERLKKGTVHSISEASILIVDDDVDLREYLKDELSAIAADVNTAAHGKAGLDFLESQMVDVVVSDVMMPVMDGFELCSAIKRDPKLHDIPVILLTARVEAKSKEYGLSLGADAYLPKPFDREALINAINKALK